MCVCIVVDNSSNWAVCGKSTGVVSMPVVASATHRVLMEVMPLFAGHLPFPSIKLLKYLPHNVTPVIPPDTGGCRSHMPAHRYTLHTQRIHFFIALFRKWKVPRGCHGCPRQLLVLKNQNPTVVD